MAHADSSDEAMMAIPGEFGSGQQEKHIKEMKKEKDSESLAEKLQYQTNQVFYSKIKSKS